MMRALMPAIIFCMIYGVLGIRWARQEREENRARRQKLNY